MSSSSSDAYFSKKKNAGQQDRKEKSSINRKGYSVLKKR